jgi:magnesium-transporting ATPase (P-type)
MNTNELKKAITDDIDTLKTLDVDILESTLYYREYRHWVVIGFLLMWIPTVLASVLAVPFQWKDFVRDPVYNLIFIFIAPTLLSMLWMTTYFGLIGQWIVFKHQIKPHLKTGNILYNAMLPLCKKPYFVYVALLIFITHFTSFFAAFLFQFAGLLFLEYAWGLLIEMEVNRVGISALFGVMKRFFKERDQSSHQPDEGITG